MYSAVKLTKDHSALLEEFCQEAAKAGYENNSSLALMKFNGKYDLYEQADFWGIMFENKLICVSGCHKWKDRTQRCLFRSATLPAYDSIVPGLNRNHMNSLPFSVMMPYQIAKGVEDGVEHFYITTSNGEHDASGKMKRTHKALQILAKNGIVDFVADEIIYSTPQTKWELNLDRYLSALRSFHGTRERLQLCLNPEYYKIIEHGFSIVSV
jgi:hypothetical protein